MKALVYTQPYHLEYVNNYPTPTIGEQEVLVLIKACGICGSDVHGYTGTTGRRIPPLIMGHEASGVIIDIGKEVKDWHKGDLVTFDSTISCGTCYYCRKGQINLCNNRRVFGVSCSEYKQNGAFAEYLAVPQNILYLLPDGLDFKKAALIEPLSVAVHAINRTALKPDDNIVVLGAGMIGLCVIQALRVYGYSKIIVVDTEHERLNLAIKLGAREALNPDKCDVVEQILKLTKNLGADIAFEAVGIIPTFTLAVNSIKKGGILTLIGNLAPIVEMPLQSIVAREINICGSYISSGEYPICLEMIAKGDVDVEILISATAPLSQGAAWFHQLNEKNHGLMKVILIPDEQKEHDF